ncbi:MAG: CDP-alcohol phosphatidyltransferase family protein [Longimicrobiales bacterium]
MSALDFGRGPGVLRDLALGLVPYGSITAATWWLLELSATYVALSLGLYGALAALLAATHPGPSANLGPGLGSANRITFGRAALALPVVALAPLAPELGSEARWWVIVLATVAMSLDGLDGRVARRTGTTSDFGARFDMELDAFLLLGLSVLVLGSGKVGAWILLVGGMRYLFVAAGWILPALTGELPESFRRKTVCVVQGVVLLVCLGPIIPSWLASAAGMGALLLLVHSFAVDTWWLLRRRGSESGGGAAPRRSSGGGPSDDPGSPHPAPEP